VSLNRQTYKLPASLSGPFAAARDDWKKNEKVRRLWQCDASLWTGTDEGKWLAWLGITAEQLAHLSALQEIAADIRQAGFKHALLLGMGGSSLCPEVLRMTFGKIDGYPELHVLDSTDPAQIKAIESKVDLSSTVCVVSSKSGSTLEPNIYKQYFFERVKEKVGEAEVGKRFIAITDPGSKLQEVAERDKFRKIFMGVPGIGGRYSALSNFGMVPAAVMGIDVAKFLNNTAEMVKACGAAVPADSNPGALLGMISSLLVFQLGQARVWFAMSRDGLLPRIFSRVHPRFQTPDFSTLMAGIVVGIPAGLLDIGTLADLSNIGTLFAFALVAGGVLILRYREPERRRAFRAPGGPIAPILTILTCLLLMAGLPITNWIRFFVWMVIGLVIYYNYGRKRSTLRAVARP